MSGGHGKGGASRLSQAFVLAVLFALLLVATRLMPALEGGGVVAATGFLLLAGTLTSSLLEVVGLPHLTGYLLAGAIAGPHVLHIVDHHTVDELKFASSLALALIAFAGGAELKIELLKKEIRVLSWALFIQTALGAVVMTAVFFAASRLMPFMATLPTKGAFGVAMIWGAIAVSRSPSALLGILSQTRASGPVTNHSVGFVMLSDVVVVVLFSATLMVGRTFIDPSTHLSMHALEELGHELLGSVSIGTTLGLLLAAYMRLSGAQLILVLLAVSVGVWEAIKYLQFDALLSFLVAGFVVQNLSAQGEKFLHAIEQASGVVFVVFFATAGAHLDMPLLAQLGPVALLLSGSRALVTFVCSRVVNAVAKPEDTVARYGWTPLVSQAGLTLGLVVIVERAFPTFGPALRSLAVATVAINEVVGPVLFKWGLDRAGESSKAPPTSRASLTTEP